MVSNLAPGCVFTADFRAGPLSNAADSTGSVPIKILQWNIERGYELDKVINELQDARADIIALQEIDVGCERSNSKDTGIDIAKALGMNYAFVCEFEEIKSHLRNARSQGGGFHGNAILSRWDLADVRAIEHRCHPIDWNASDLTHPLAKKEPRKGRRLSLAAKVLTPQGPIVCYSAHLEVFCGMLARISQFCDILQDSRAQIDKGEYHQAILGDLNTMGHAIARFSPSFCTDKMRFRNLGQTEAQFWDKQVLQQPDPNYQVENDSKQGFSRQEEVRNARLQQLGAPDDVCRDALNPGFEDPFDPLHTITLDNPDYRFFGISLMKGKLDWLLLRRCRVLGKLIGNHSYAASDHKWLMASVQLLNDQNDRQS